MKTSSISAPMDACYREPEATYKLEKKNIRHLSQPSLYTHVISGTLLNQSHTVSACHGAGDDPIAPKCYPSRFFQWWNSVFPHPASELTNGAMRRTDSAYFSFCNSHHLPDNTDLVILDFDVDDPK